MGVAGMILIAAVIIIHVGSGKVVFPPLLASS
jgi:hypothetical protein